MSRKKVDHPGRKKRTSGGKKTGPPSKDQQKKESDGVAGILVRRKTETCSKRPRRPENGFHHKRRTIPSKRPSSKIKKMTNGSKATATIDNKSTRYGENENPQDGQGKTPKDREKVLEIPSKPSGGKKKRKENTHLPTNTGRVSRCQPTNPFYPEGRRGEKRKITAKEKRKRRTKSPQQLTENLLSSKKRE